MSKNQKEVDEKIRMLASIHEVFNFKKKNPEADAEKVIKHISKFVVQEKHKETKMAMIAAASNALKLLETNSFSEREIIKKIMPELKEIMDKID